MKPETQVKEKEERGIQPVPLEQIEDNRFQPRRSYPTKKIAELAESIQQVGLIEVPVGRRINPLKIELAVGHLRVRAFRKLAKEKGGQRFESMPVEIRDLTDEQLFTMSIEENLKRADITPIEVARALEAYLKAFPDSTEEAIGKRLNMTQANISNMLRVLRLPAEVLEKIDDGRINFTMGRELLVFQGVKAGHFEKWSKTEGKSIKHPKDEKYMMLETIKRIRTPESTSTYGTFPPTVEGMQKAIDATCKEELRPLEKGVCYSVDPLFDTAPCLKCESMITTHPTKSGVQHFCSKIECWEKKQQEHKDKMAAEAQKKMQQDVLAKVAQQEAGSISQEMKPGKTAVTDKDLAVYARGLKAETQEKKETESRLQSARSLPANYPCHGCLNVAKCDRSTVVAGEKDTFTCENVMTKETAPKVQEKATVAIPDELKKLIKEKAGTRAEILDLRELALGLYGGELKQGYARLDGYGIDGLLDKAECIEKCTTGFHYGFDSRDKSGEIIHICSNTKCLAQKKAAFTRAKNAAGMAKKKAEAAAIRTAVDQTTAVLDRARMKLIIASFIEGRQAYYYTNDDKSRTPSVWFPDKLKVEKGGDVWAALDKISEEDLAKLVVEYCLLSLTHSGDIQTYKIKTTLPLNWMGITPMIAEKGHDERGRDKSRGKDSDTTTSTQTAQV